MAVPLTCASEDASSDESLWLRAFKDVLALDDLSEAELDDLTEDSDFFRSGGYSLLIPQLVSRYEALAGWRPPVRLVFEFSSPRELERETATRREPADTGGP
ncbi:phosphopantetheine-binding protein [Nocardioides sp. InS609-2]|uniref:phosphopantetheine-binding protein n=1 Tax=Nocardioides sp. InS609-2 TaxID=2760705 RepID=UPI0020C12A1A|nr:phosphopantetheine-binding protein [Nocardioides sp. InS609-2]